MSADKPTGETRTQRLEMIVIAALCVLLLGVLGMLWLSQHGYFTSQPVVETHPGMVPEKPVELNTARWWELMQIRGIGEKRAKQIIELRRQKAGFHHFDELTEISGITPEIITEMQKHIRLESPPRTDRDGK